MSAFLRVTACPELAEGRLRVQRFLFTLPLPRYFVTSTPRYRFFRNDGLGFGCGLGLTIIAFSPRLRVSGSPCLTVSLHFAVTSILRHMSLYPHTPSLPYFHTALFPDTSHRKRPETTVLAHPGRIRITFRVIIGHRRDGVPPRHGADL